MENFRQLRRFAEYYDTVRALCRRTEVSQLSGVLVELRTNEVLMALKGLRERLPDTRLGVVLFQTTSMIATAPVEELAVLRTNKGVAHLTGWSPEHLSRVAKADGVRVRQIVDVFLCVRAAHEKRTTGKPWDDIARRFGYASVSGLHALFRRANGLGLREAQEPQLCLSLAAAKLSEEEIKSGEVESSIRNAQLSRRG
jgi:AraC-like DNA-binding protein